MATYTVEIQEWINEEEQFVDVGKITGMDHAAARRLIDRLIDKDSPYACTTIKEEK